MLLQRMSLDMEREKAMIKQGLYVAHTGFLAEFALTVAGFIDALNCIEGVENRGRVDRSSNAKGPGISNSIKVSIINGTDGGRNQRGHGDFGSLGYHPSDFKRGSEFPPQNQSTSNLRGHLVRPPSVLRRTLLRDAERRKISEGRKSMHQSWTPARTIQAFQQ